MQVTYTLDPTDLTQYEKFYATRRQKGFIIIRITRIAAPIIVLISIVYSLASANHAGTKAIRTSLWDVFISTVLPILIVLSFWVFFRNARRKSFSPLCSHPHTLQISPQNIQHRNEGIETTIQWDRVNEIASDERSLYFFIDEVTSYIIPRRAFQTPPLADTFFATAIAYKSGNAAPTSNAEIWPPAPHTGTVLKEEKRDDE